MTRPKKAFKDLTPAYKKRLESAYKSGKFGQGYTSAGRAYAAGASRTVARGQAKTSESERQKRRYQAKKAKAWSDKHSKQAATKYQPEKFTDPVEKAKYTDDYLKAMHELEKGWKKNTKTGNRQKINVDTLDNLFKDYEPEETTNPYEIKD
jgi:hypothetical protein